MFGGVYFWSAAILAIGVAGLLAWTRPRIETPGWAGVLDLALLALLAAIAAQLIPLPVAILSVISPARVPYAARSSLQGELPAFLPISLDWRATAHGWLATFCSIATFWIARAIFSRGGIRAVVTLLAWCSIVVVLIAVAQSAADTHLVYGLWRPFDAGARPLGPFINRNHFGTWSILVLFLCFGCFQWRRTAMSPSRGWSWRARLAHALDGRSMILVLALLLLTISIALGASRSTMLALAAAAGYVAATAPRGQGTRRSSLWTLALGLAAVLAVVAYADVDRLLSRLDETRQLGLAQRVAIWRDTAGVIHDFPATGTGAGNFSTAMRVYQTSDRTYFWNEAHNHYLQIAAEGGLLLVIPSLVALSALVVLSIRQLRRRDDPLHWMRLGASAALVAVAVQSLWETGLSLPATGMVAAVAAALVTLPQSARSTTPSAPGPVH